VLCISPGSIYLVPGLANQRLPDDLIDVWPDPQDRGPQMRSGLPFHQVNRVSPESLPSGILIP
jgi:hypothetical protein